MGQLSIVVEVRSEHGIYLVGMGNNETTTGTRDGDREYSYEPGTVPNHCQSLPSHGGGIASRLVL